MKFKKIAGTISIIMMLSTPTLVQAHVASNKSLVPLMSQSEIVRLRAKTSHQAKAIARRRTHDAKIGIEIASLTNDQLRISVDQQVADNVILQVQVKALGLDVTGLTNDEIRIQLKTASHAKQIATLQAQAKARDIDITGLTNDQAWLKIKAIDRTTTLTRLLAQAKTLGIGINKEQII